MLRSSLCPCPWSHDLAALHIKWHISLPFRSEFSHVTRCGTRGDIHDSRRGLKKCCLHFEKCNWETVFLLAFRYQCHHHENMPRLACRTMRGPWSRAEVFQLPQSKPARRSQEPVIHNMWVSPAEPRTAAHMSPGEQPNLKSQPHIANHKLSKCLLFGGHWGLGWIITELIL